ncbi:MAG: universal stress protein [Marinobacter sp.]|nr:universal stress protein [Marinobacter sp.]
MAKTAAGTRTVIDALTDQVGSGAPPGRVLVLLDGSRMSYAALEEAARIAAATGADVLGLFVEELNLLRSAGYGFAREVGSASGVSRPFNKNDLEQRIHRLAGQAGQALAEAVGRYGGRHTLNIRRGSVVEEVLALAGPGDLLVLGRVGWSSAPGARLGSTARGLLRRSPGRVLLWCERPVLPLGRVVVFLNDHDEANHRAILAAAEAVRHARRPVSVLLVDHAGMSPERLEAIRQGLGVAGSEIRVRTLPATDPVTITQILRQEGAAQLVVSRESSLLRQPGAEQLLIALNLPVTVTP